MKAVRRAPVRRIGCREERGAALLTAMIIVTLVATLATAMVWQQWRAVKVESAERARTEASWILAGALEFGVMILQEDQNGSRRIGGATMLTQPWATPLAESRLSTFLSADAAADSDDGVAAFLSGTIADAQAKYNLANLIGKPTGTIDPQLDVWKRLCTTLNIDASVAGRIANGMRSAGPVTAASGATGTAPLLPQTTAQLVWFGTDAATAQALDRYVVILPSPTPVNVNTAGKEVLAAVLSIDPGSAESLLQARQRAPFRDLDQLQRALRSTTLPDTSVADVKSSYFEVSGRLRLADHVVSQRSLVWRQPDPRNRPKVLRREVVATVEELAR